METIYFVQIKGINENRNCWTTTSCFDTLKEAIKNYYTYTGGCCKRIRRVRTIKKTKIMRFKKY